MIQALTPGVTVMPWKPPYSWDEAAPSNLIEPFATFGTINVVFPASDQGPVEVTSKVVMSNGCAKTAAGVKPKASPNEPINA